MHRIFAVGIIAALYTLASRPADADWNYVKWGMTKKAAIDASKGEARPIRKGEDVGCAFVAQQPFAVIPKKTIGEFVFSVTFCTAEGGEAVTSVALSAASGTNPNIIKRALVSQYGQPSQVGSTAIWNDAKTGNTISFWSLGGTVAEIEYKKLGRSGL